MTSSSDTPCFSRADRPPLIPSDSFLDRSRSRRPVWLLLLFGLVVFSPLLEGGTTHLAVMAIRLLILLFLSLYVMKGIRVGALLCPPFPAGPAVLAYLALAVVSTVRSPYTHQSLQWLVVLIGYAALLYLLVSFLVRWNDVVKLLAVLVGMGFCEAGWGLVQGWWFGMARPTGTFFNPNFLAGYLSIVWAVVLGYLCYVRVGQVRRGHRLGLAGMIRVPRRIMPIATLTVLLLALVRTASRGGMLAVLVATGVVLGLRFGRRGLGVLLLVALPMAFLLPNPFHDRLKTEHMANPVSYARWQIWQSSVREMGEFPLGIGLGLYQYEFPRHNFPVEGQIARYGKIAQTAHNEFLQMGVELGVAGLLVFCWGIAVVAREAAAVLKQRLTRRQRGLLVGLVAATTGMLAHAAVDATLHEPALAVALTLCVGILLSARRLVQRVVEPMSTLPIRFPAVWAVVGVVSIVGATAIVIRVGLAWAAFDAGSQALAQRDLHKAIDRYQVAVALDSGKALYHSSMGAAYFQAFERTGDGAAAQAAIEELQSAMILNPLDGRLPGLLGHVYAALSRTDSAQNLPEEQRTSHLRSAAAAYERAVALEPFTPWYRLELGRLHLAFGDSERAEAWVRGALEIEPNFLPGREWLARLYLESGRIDSADREYREILERQQRYAAWVKDPLEERFLKVDAQALERGFEKVGTIERKRAQT